MRWKMLNNLRSALYFQSEHNHKESCFDLDNNSSKNVKFKFGVNRSKNSASYIHRTKRNMILKQNTEKRTLFLLLNFKQLEDLIHFVLKI